MMMVNSGLIFRNRTDQVKRKAARITGAEGYKLWVFL